MAVERLRAATLGAARTAARPTYDRTVAPRFVHLGVGAFARAHLGTYADDLSAAGWPAMVRGVSLHSHRAEGQLEPQDGLYALVVREPAGDEPIRIVGSIQSAATGFDAAVQAIAAPTTELVTLTITEKGYEHGAPAVAAVSQGLAARRDGGLPPPVVASLDNVADNGRVLRQRVLEVASAGDPALAEWVAAEVSFPSSVVDRMVPATRAHDLDEVERRIGLRDEAAVVSEHLRFWAITAVPGLPPLADVGVEVVGDVAEHERRKLWLLNGPHSAVAYTGLLCGHETIASALGDARVAAFVRGYLDDVLEVAALPDRMQPRAFASEVLGRFANASLGHRCQQVGADGSEKLAQRVLPVVAACEQLGWSTARPAVVVAVWLAAVAGLPVRAQVLPTLDDPVAHALREWATDGGDLDQLVERALAGRASRAFCGEVAGTLARVLTDGPDVLVAPT